jgi:hypothetical protein
MPSTTDIVADGAWRIRKGSTRRLQARLTQRTAGLLERASFWVAFRFTFETGVLFGDRLRGERHHWKHFIPRD